MKRIIDAHEADSQRRCRADRPVAASGNFEAVSDLVADKVAKASGRISARLLLPLARAAGYDGSARNFR